MGINFLIPIKIVCRFYCPYLLSLEIFLRSSVSYANIHFLSPRFIMSAEQTQNGVAAAEDTGNQERKEEELQQQQAEESNEDGQMDATDGDSVESETAASFDDDEGNVEANGSSAESSSTIGSASAGSASNGRPVGQPTPPPIERFDDGGKQHEQQQRLTPQKTSVYGRNGHYGRGVGSAVENPSMKVNPGGGYKLGRRQSWADAAMEDDLSGGLGNPSVSYIRDFANIERKEELMKMLNGDDDNNNDNEDISSATGSTEEEREARRERIRARQEERLSDYTTTAGDDATHQYYRAADGSIKKLPSFAREEYLESIKEGGIPVKSWLAVVAVVGVGLYQLVKIVKGPEVGRKGRKAAAATPSPAKKRAGGKVKEKKGSSGKRIAASASSANSPRSSPPDLVEAKSDPELDLYIEPEPKPEPKRAKKRLTKKKRAKKTIPASTSKQNGAAAPASDAITSSSDDNDDKGGKANAAASSVASSDPVSSEPATATVSATGIDADLQLNAYNEDDRRAIVQVLTDDVGDTGADDGEWQTAGRKSKASKKPKEQQPKASAPSNPPLGIDTINQEEEKDAKSSEQINATSAGTTGDADTDTSAAAVAAAVAPAEANGSELENNEEEAKTGTAEEKPKDESKGTNGQKKKEEESAAKDEEESEAKKSDPATSNSALDDTKVEPLNTQEDDAALARKLQEEEENMAAREKGETVDEMWEEVPKRRSKKKNAATSNAAPTPSTAIAAM